MLRTFSVTSECAAKILSILQASRAGSADAYVTCSGLLVRCVPPAVACCQLEASLLGLVGL